jgi:hypothetical protein
MRREDCLLFVRGLQSVKVCALATRSPANSRAAAERVVECMLLLAFVLSGSFKRVVTRYMEKATETRDAEQLDVENECVLEVKKRNESG